MRVRNGVRVLAGLALTAAAISVLPSGVALASTTTVTYDDHANGGAGEQLAIGMIGFTLGNLTYMTDQPVSSSVLTSDESAPLSADATDGVLDVNTGADLMSALDISLMNGDPMKVSGFDFDAGGTTGTVSLIPDGIVANEVTITSGHVDVSANPNFSSVTTLDLSETDDGIFRPTIDNFAYTDMGTPAVTTDGGSASFVAGDNTGSTPVVVDSGLTFTAVTTTMESATVAITGNFQAGQDILAFTNDGSSMGNISGVYNASVGALTLTSAGATALIAQWQSALDSVTYTDSAITPNSATRTVSFTAVDGNGTSSNTATRTVTVAATDQTPIVNTTGAVTNYVLNGSPVTVGSNAVVSDLDGPTQASATIAVTSGFHSGDILSFTNDSSSMGNIVGFYNVATGVLTMTSAGATATDAQWANALDAVVFSSSSSTVGNRIVSFAVNDGIKTSAPATNTVAVLGPPTITTDSGSASFVAGDNATSTPVVVDPGLTVTDGVSSMFTSATISVAGNFQAGEDVLSFSNDGSTMGNVSAAYISATGEMMLASSGSTATVAQWQAALRSVTYTDSAVTPNTSTRTISFSVVDAASNTSNTATRTVTVAATDQTPVVTTSGSTVSYVVGNSPVVVDSTVAVSDLDNTTQASAIVTVGAGFAPAADTLSFVNTSSATFGNIFAMYNPTSGTLLMLSLGATADNVQWANALRSVAFSSSATAGNRTISFAVNDGVKSSVASTDTVNVTAPVVVTPAPPSSKGILRVAGSDRIATAIAASQYEFSGRAGSLPASAVVLVNQNDSIDALTGAPLAAVAHAPLLFVDPDQAPATVVIEIHRLLGSSGQVYLLGGTTMISDAVTHQLQGEGFAVQRIAGADRYSTAVAIADQVSAVKGAPTTAFEVTGLDAADAFAAAPAAANAAGVVLLTVGTQPSIATAAWLGTHASIVRYAVGGYAVAADPSAIAVTGADRDATAVAVATRFFPSASGVSVANGQAWPDVAVAASDSALDGMPLLMVATNELTEPTTVWLTAHAGTLMSVTAFGGTARISPDVLNAVATSTGLALS